MICPCCGAAATTGWCTYCGVALDRAGTGPRRQEIRSGDALAELDFRHVPLPGQTKKQTSLGRTRTLAHADGIEVISGDGISATWVDEYVRLADLVGEVRFTALTPGAIGGLLFRQARVGSARITYVFDVDSERQAVRFARRYSTEKESLLHELGDGWQKHSAVAKLGQSNRVEVRVQSGELQGWVNGKLAAWAWDPVLGIGRAGVRIATRKHPGDQRLVLHRYRICEAL